MRPLLQSLAPAAALALAVPSARVAGANDLQPPTIGVTAAEVAVDFVVRDKKGRIVRDLRPADVEVYEDGVRQDLVLFDLVSAAPAQEAAATRDSAEGPPSTAAAPRMAPPAAHVEREAFVALVFDRLSPVARRNAQQAALEWLKLPAVSGRQVGVFRIDQGLEEVAPFSDERSPVMQAIDEVALSASTSHRAAEDRERLRSLRQQVAMLEGRVVSPGGPGSAADSGAEIIVPAAQKSPGRVEDEVRRRQLSTEIAMLQALESLERDQAGLATTNGLLALVNGLRGFPGRKAVVFFSEGLALPDRVAATLTAVISEANRAGVSFYAADAAGLRTRSGADEARRELVTIADAIGSSSQGDDTIASQRSLTRMMERNEDVLRMDPASGLSALARETGGFLIRDTNAIALGLRRVEEELGAYYLLSYAPKNEVWDGRYRRIELRSRRAGLSVQSRRGYYAVRTPTPTPVLEYEAPALAGLERAPRARDLDVSGAVLQFPEEAGSVVAVVASLPGGAPAMVASGDGLAQDFTLLTLVRDPSGRIVHKASRHYELSWPKSKTEQVRSSRILYDGQAHLPPGRYVVETVAWDAKSRLAGVHRAALVVPLADSSGPRLSSLLVIGHTERRALGDDGPLQYQGMHLFPSLGEPLHLAPGAPLAFAFTVVSGARPVHAAEVELVRGDAVVRRSTVPLPASDATGQVRVVAGLPIEGVEAGDYTLRLVVNDGAAMQTRSAELTLAR